MFDDVPQDSSTDVVERCAAAAKEAGADSFLAVGGGSVMDTAKVADAVFTHGGSAREQEGFFLMPRGADGMGRPLEVAPLACIPTTAGTGSEVSMAAVIKDHEAKVKLEIADFPLFPRLAILDPETTRTLPAARGRRHRHGRDDPRDRGLRVHPTGARTRTRARCRRCA